MLSFPNLHVLEEDLKLLRSKQQALTVLIDGPSGSGKTTLADIISRSWPPTQELYVLHMDDLYPGWDGLTEAVSLVSNILTLRSHGQPGIWQRYDWTLGNLAEWHEIPPDVPLLIEGCGSICRGADKLSDVRIWCDAPVALRYQRALSRGGENFEHYWDRWELQYHNVQAQHGPESIATHTFITKTDTLDI